MCATVETSLRDTHYDKATLDTAKPTTVLASLTGVTTVGTVLLLYYIEPLGILNGKVARHTGSRQPTPSSQTTAVISNQPHYQYLSNFFDDWLAGFSCSADTQFCAFDIEKEREDAHAADHHDQLRPCSWCGVIISTSRCTENRNAMTVLACLT